MGIIDNIFGRLGYYKAAFSQPVPAFLQAEAAAASQQFQMGFPSLGESSSELYEKLTWVQIAVSSVANFASLHPLNVYRLVGEEREAVANHPFEKLLFRPNPMQSRFELLRDTFSYQTLSGNSFWWLNRTRADVPPSELWTLPAHKVRPVPDENMYIRGYIYQVSDEVEIPLETWEVVHFKKFHPTDTYKGLGTEESISLIGKGDLAMQHWNLNFFGKDNAKPPGLLVFGTMGDDQWKALKETFIERHGGDKRQFAMLRGLPSTSEPRWVSMGMPQSDIEFHLGRQSNREEIYSLYAPGLASVLDVNATEANSLAGKKTLIEFGVWPHMVAMAEKISNDLLPAYGPDLLAEFEDPRITDRAMRLAEQGEFARYHTINEVRSEFYGDDPLSEEVGDLLPAQVSPVSAPAPVGDPVPFQEPVTLSDPTPETVDPEPDEALKSSKVVDVAAARDEKKFRKWLKRNPGKPFDRFESAWLDEAAKRKIAMEVGIVEDAPFPVDRLWSQYP